MEDKDFDLKMRSMLEDGQEEVPAGLWSAIEGRLPAAPAAKAPVIWWKWLGAGTAVAASVAIVLLLGFRKTNPDDGVQIESIQAPVVADAPQTEHLAQTPVTVVDAIREVRAAETVNPVTETKPSEVTEVTECEADETECEAYETAACPTTEQANEPEYCTTDFDENGIELKEKRYRNVERIALEAFSDATSNTNPTFRKSDIGVMRKPTAPKVTSIEETSASNYGIPVSAGVGVKIPLKGRWSIGTGLNWSMLTRSFSGQYNQVDSEGNVISQTSYSSIRNTQHYLGVPLDVYFSIVNKDFVDFYAYAGGSANKCLSNRYTMTGPESPLVYKSPETGWQFSAGVGMGVEFIVAQRIGFYIDPSVNYWFNYGKAKNIRTHQPLMMGLELGMRIRL